MSLLWYGADGPHQAAGSASLARLFVVLHVTLTAPDSTIIHVASRVYCIPGVVLAMFFQLIVATELAWFR